MLSRCGLEGTRWCVHEGISGVVLRGSVGAALRGSVGVFGLESGKKQRKTIDSHNKLHALITNTQILSRLLYLYTCKYQTQYTKYIRT